MYTARDTRPDRFIAIKVLSEHIAKREDLRARFEREARAVASLNHPNICVLHDIGNQDGVGGYTVMEYLEGETLEACLERGALPLDGALRYGMQISHALDRAAIAKRSSNACWRNIGIQEQTALTPVRFPSFPIAGDPSNDGWRLSVNFTAHWSRGKHLAPSHVPLAIQEAGFCGTLGAVIMVAPDGRAGSPSETAPQAGRKPVLSRSASTTLGRSQLGTRRMRRLKS